MLLLGLEFGGVIYPWSSAIVICLIIFGAITCVIFFVYEDRFARYPLIPLRLFNRPSNIASLGVCFSHGYVFIAGTYYLPLYFQSVLGASPLRSGIYLLPFALTLALVSALTGVFIKKTGQYLPPIWFGLVLMCVGFGLLIDLPPNQNWTKIVLYQMVAGIGSGPNFQSPLLAFQSGVNPRDMAAATATFGFVRNLSSSISVVIGGVVFQNVMQKQQATLLAALGPDVARALQGGSAGASVEIIKTLDAQGKIVSRRAFGQSLKMMWIMYVVIAACGLLISVFVGKRVLSVHHVITKTGLGEEESKRLEEEQRRKEGKVKISNGGNEKALTSQV